MNTFSLAPARAFPTRLGLLLLPYFLPTSCLVPNIYRYTCNTLLLKWELNLSGREVSESQHQRQTRVLYFIAGTLGEKKGVEKKRKHEAGGQDPVLPETVIRLSTLCPPGLDKGCSSGGGILGPGASHWKPAGPAKG